jgi:hypothetical protein
MEDTSSSLFALLLAFFFTLIEVPWGSERGKECRFMPGPVCSSMIETSDFAFGLPLAFEAPDRELSLL